MDIVKTEGGSESKTQLPFGTIQFSDDERLFLQNQLENKLTQDDISNRPGPNGTPVYYIETWRAIEIANQTFGFNGWSSRIMETTTDYLEQVETTGKFNVGVSATVRIMLKDGCFHEDLGYGTAENQKYKGAAIEHAKKKAVSDGLKRALRNFGNALGLTIYDKTHIDKVKRESKRAKTNVVKQPKLVNPHFSHTQSSSNSTQANETSTQQLLTSQTQHAAQPQHSTPPNPDPTEASLSKIKAETNDIKLPPNTMKPKKSVPEVSQPTLTTTSSPINEASSPQKLTTGTINRPAVATRLPGARLPPRIPNAGQNINGKRPNSTPPDMNKQENGVEGDEQQVKRQRLSEEM